MGESLPHCPSPGGARDGTCSIFPGGMIPPETPQIMGESLPIAPSPGGARDGTCGAGCESGGWGYLSSGQSALVS